VWGLRISRSEPANRRSDCETILRQRLQHTALLEREHLRTSSQLFVNSTRNTVILLIVSLVAISILACSGGDHDNKVFDPESSLIATLDFSSPAFEDGDTIPVEYTCDGANSSPPLKWSDVPTGTRSLAVVVDDPDASSGIFRHWSVIDIPAASRSLQAQQPTDFELKDSIRQANNDFGHYGYGGPCPPSGEEHEYIFFIFALTEPINLEDDANPQDVSSALRGKVIGTGSFSGMYARR